VPLAESVWMLLPPEKDTSNNRQLKK